MTFTTAFRVPLKLDVYNASSGGRHPECGTVKEVVGGFLDMVDEMRRAMPLAERSGEANQK